VEQSEWERTFRTLIYILIAFIVFNLLFGPPPPVTTPDGNVTIMETRPSIIVTLFNIINLAFASFCLLLTCRVRGFIRYNYDIPEAQCLGCEDICCSFWCGCCTLAQMARQTVDYDLEQATCCTNDGLFPLQNRGAVTI
jgi:Cys-rich protein (TIGR01571 family)